ncbi:MAG: protein translocase subunit SecF [Acidobacteria bacterium]|nr:protein translocase subunit SecF [Acidobacteriota bacterium]MCK6685398.1 protein translocase subunit SecF [Thermoanaerobaculia bacterium]
MRFFKNASYDFLKYQKPGLLAAGIAVALSLAALLARGGPNLGVDFTGGTSIVYGFAKTPSESEIRQIVEKAGVKVESVQRFDKPEKNQVLLRVPQDKVEGRDISGEVTKALRTALFPAGAAGVFDLNLNGVDALQAKLLAEDPEKKAASPSADARAEYGRLAQAIIDTRSRQGLFRSIDDVSAVPGINPATVTWLKEKTVVGPFTLLNAESVGPQVGKDLRAKGLWAVALSWAAMALYIAWRFKAVSFGTMTMVSLVNNVLITLGFCAVIDMEISLTIVASFLTLIGYSVNDTVVIFDRIREIRQISKKLPLREIANRALNETLSRTVLTAGCTLIALVVMCLLGGSVLRDFALVMLVGIVVGTYSTIFVAVPLVLIWEEARVRREAAAAAQAGSGKTNGKPVAAKSR